MSRLLSNSCLVGLEDVEEMLDRLSRSGTDGYPPYNIERVHDDDSTLRLRIVLAVAGFDIADLEVTLERSRLVIRGAQKAQDEGRIFLHRGIAARQFQKTFVLADGMQISGAVLKNGLLSVLLERPLATGPARRIAIGNDGN